jgi:hypothetical protein
MSPFSALRPGGASRPYATTGRTWRAAAPAAGPAGRSHHRDVSGDGPASRCLGVSRRVWTLWACPGGYECGAGGAAQGKMRRRGGFGDTDTPPCAGRGIRIFSVSRLQSEAAVDPLGNDGPSRPETTRAESVEPPYTTPFGNGADRTSSVEAPRPSARDDGSATWRITQRDRPRLTVDGPVRPPCTATIGDHSARRCRIGVSPGLLRPLLRDPPQQSADLGLAVAPMSSQRPD